MGTLREYTNDMLDLIAELEESEGEFTPEIEQKYNATKENIGEKINNYASYIAELKGDADTIDAEIKRLTARKKSISNKIDGMKANLLYNLKSLEMADFKTDLYKAAVHKSKSVVVDENTMLDSVSSEVEEFTLLHPYLDVKITPKKSDMMKRYKNNGVLPEWASVVENESINIR